MPQTDAAHGTRAPCALAVLAASAISGAMALVLAHSAFGRTPEPDKDPRSDIVTDYVGSFEAVPLAGPFEYPWSFAFLPDGAVLLTERAGRMQFIPQGGVAREVAGLPPMLNEGQAGPLDVVLDRKFAANGFLYLSYVHGPAEESTLRVMRARFDREIKALTDAEVIFESTAAESTEQFGGRIAVTGDGHLFLTLGDRWDHWLAQDLTVHAGKIVRIRTDGTVPADNPFVDVPGARPEIWSYGHRNPLGLAIDEGTGLLWSHENGPQGGDELNLIEPGRNYGWPVISHGQHYSGEPIPGGTARAGMEQPVHAWTPAIAPSGLAVAERETGPVFWIGALAGNALIRLDYENGKVASENRFLEDDIGRIRDVRIGPDGLLYVVTDDAEGWLYRLDPVTEQAERAGRPRRF